MSGPRPEVRVALIGYGLAGSVFHAPLITSCNGFSLSGVVTSNSQRIAQALAEHPRIKIFQTVEELWAAADQFDLVVVASPNRFHHEHARAALEAGLHVVVDKPVASSVEECRELISLSRKKGKLLTVFHNRRWDNDFLTIKKLTEDNRLGIITRMESRYERYRPEPRANAWRESADNKDAGGLLYDLGSHLIDQACTLFGEPSSVYAELDKRRAGAEVDDDAFVALHFPSGVRAHLWASSVSRIQGPRFRLLGLQGSYEKFGIDPQEDALRKGKFPAVADWGTEPEEAWGHLRTSIGDLVFDGKLQTLPGNYLQFYIELHAAITGDAPVPVAPEDALRTMQIIEAASKSATAGSVVQLERSRT